MRKMFDLSESFVDFQRHVQYKPNSAIIQFMSADKTQFYLLQIQIVQHFLYEVSFKDYKQNPDKSAVNLRYIRKCRRISKLRRIQTTQHIIQHM